MLIAEAKTRRALKLGVPAAEWLGRGRDGVEDLPAMSWSVTLYFRRRPIRRDLQ
jgi:hypothetical protein